MKEFVISETKVETAVIVGLITPQQNERKTTEYLNELEFLADTAGAKVVRRFTQRVNGPSSVTYIGSGKLEEIAAFLKQKEDEEDPVGMVIFDDELSAKQIRNIEKALQVKILDRTSLILDIFAMRAQTAAAKTQVELAQYRYMLPRLTRLWTHLKPWTTHPCGTRGLYECGEIHLDEPPVQERHLCRKQTLCHTRHHRA